MTTDIKTGSEMTSFKLQTSLIPGQYGIQKRLQFRLETADIAVLKFCLRSPFVGVLIL